jgi:hypothetical protein
MTATAGLALSRICCPSVDTRACESLAAVRCVECGREAEPGELYRLFFADLAEVAVYCPACAEREFTEDLPLIERAGACRGCISTARDTQSGWIEGLRLR